MSEFDWIARYFAPLADAPGAAGLLDDAAELDLSGGPVAATVDALVEGVHFLPDDPIETVAKKLVRVNVSDLVAKGARPREALLTLGWRAARPEADLARFAEALGQDLALWGARLVGGDTVTAPAAAFFSLAMTGVCRARGPVRRSGAAPGDRIWVTGVIGAGGAGLEDAKAGRATAAALRYRVPEPPPLAVADLIAAHATAAMDVSDGLLADAAKLAGASSACAAITLEDVPLFKPAQGLEPVLAQCAAGDDYQALFTAPPLSDDAIQAGASAAGVAVSAIGAIEAGAGLRLTWRGGPARVPARLGFRHG